jgi:hypothetical protein
MYFPTPSPFESEYPAILKWCDPLTVSVMEVEAVSEGVEEEKEEDEDEEGNKAFVNGPPRHTLPTPMVSTALKLGLDLNLGWVVPTMEEI